MMKKDKMKSWWQFILQVLSALVAALGASSMLMLMVYMGLWQR